MKKKGKGLSFDQKRQRQLAIFHKTVLISQFQKGVFNYAEIQKESIKVGIPFPNVKDILDSLKADSLVECQKIGAGVFYWSFPSRAHQTMTDRIQITQKQIDSYNSQIKQLSEEIQAGKIGRQQTEQRKELNEELEQLRDRKSKFETEIQKYIRFDPERYELILKQNKELKNAVNVEIDNLEQIKKFIKKNNIGMKDDQIQSIYEIPANLQSYD